MLITELSSNVITIYSNTCNIVYIKSAIFIFLVYYVQLCMYTCWLVIYAIVYNKMQKRRCMYGGGRVNEI